MDNPQIAVLAEKVDALRAEVTGLRGDLKAVVDLVPRHDERIQDLEDRGKWAGGVFSAILVYLLTRVGIPHV